MGMHVYVHMFREGRGCCFPFHLRQRRKQKNKKGGVVVQSLSLPLRHHPEHPAGSLGARQVIGPNMHWFLRK